jgi:3-methyladenine DNA glycosylase AlkD
VSRHEELLAAVRALADPAGVEGQARFGITGANRLGVRVTDLRRLARGHRRDHPLAMELWSSGIHEARILATLVDDPAAVTKTQMERWVRDFDSWDIVDGACGNLFDQTPFAYDKALEWSGRKPEFQKRAGFALMAYIAVHDKSARDTAFKPFLGAIVREANDDRNFVRKAVNWALRQIGKRNQALHKEAIETALRVRALDTKAARWIAADALRELESAAVRAKVGRAS